MDTIDLPVIRLLQRLVQPSRYRSSCYRPYLSHNLLWMVSSIILGIVMGFIFSSWALNSRSVMEVGGVFPNEKMRLGLLSPT